MMQQGYWADGIWGVIVGDALGVPVQFMTREEIKNRKTGKVTGMEGYGCFHLPEGSWSDDSSLTLATLASIKENEKIDETDIMQKFVAWLYNGAFTPFGSSFDVGNTCREAIINYGCSPLPETCGVTGEYANGNGALMRIMPVCLYYYELQQKLDHDITEEAVAGIHRVASLTHNHMRSNMACGLYYFMVREILDNKDTMPLDVCIQMGLAVGRAFYGTNVAKLMERGHYNRIFDMNYFKNLEESAIKSSGYVVDSLEAAIYCLVTTDNLEECMLKAVNLGDDTDTIAAIAGGIAGLYYGKDSIPKAWMDVIQNKELITGVLG